VTSLFSVAARWASAGLLFAPVLLQTCPARASGSRPPDFPVTSSCHAAEEFSGGGADARKKDYESCMRDEATAKDELGKRWSTFKAVDKKHCEEQQPNPSYVEMLTCLEMDTSRMIGDTQVPQIGGPVAPGLSTGNSAGH
jgi:hypothetical protein